VVHVLRAEAGGAILLLQRLDADRPLSSLPPDQVADVLGAMVADLAVPGPPADVPSTTAEVRDLAERGRSRWEALGRPVPELALGEALATAAGLAADDPGLAVDGDLHADQVLAAYDGGWRVVDPVLMRGDPAYDLARAVWTTVDRLPDDASVRRFADRLVRATGLDRSRARAWLRVRTVSYWLWAVEAGLTEDPLRCARVVAATSTRDSG
jgi:streptomycin 6-kinase